MAEISEYEKIRTENIERNEDFLRSIGLDSAKPDMSTASKRDPSKRGVTKRKAPGPAIPTRRSGRVTIERLKSEDFSMLSKEDREKKEEELAAMIEAKANAQYTPAAEEIEERERYQRFSVENLSCFPARNQPAPDNYVDEEDAEKRDELTKIEQQSEEAKAWSYPILDTLKANSAPIATHTKSTKCDSNSKSKASKDSGSTARMKSLIVRDSEVAKVTESRITSVWVHPSEEKLIVVAGDKQGYLGVWDVVEGEEGDNDNNSKANNKLKKVKKENEPQYGDRYSGRSGVGGVWKYRPHVSAVCRIYSTSQTPSEITSVSYDGTVRSLDIDQQAFISRFSAPSDLGDLWFTDAWEYGGGVRDISDSGSGNNKLFVSRSDGYACLIDFRQGSKGRGNSSYAWVADMGYKTQSVQHFPTDENLLLTACAGAGGDISLYDIRKLGGSSKKITESVLSFNGHSKSINAAYASPDGKSIVSVCQDDTIRLWTNFQSQSSSSKNDKNASSVTFSVTNHNNHTGRWLSTFRPTWDPKFNASFVSGSMNKPRCIEYFSVNYATKEGSKAVLASPVVLRDDQMASVCSRNAVHPTQDIIAAANSSGRVHVLR